MHAGSSTVWRLSAHAVVVVRHHGEGGPEPRGRCCTDDGRLYRCRECCRGRDADDADEDGLGDEHEEAEVAVCGGRGTRRQRVRVDVQKRKEGRKDGEGDERKRRNDDGPHLCGVCAAAPECSTPALRGSALRHKRVRGERGNEIRD